MSNTASRDAMVAAHAEYHAVLNDPTATPSDVNRVAGLLGRATNARNGSGGGLPSDSPANGGATAGINNG